MQRESEEILSGWFDLNGTECYLFYVELPNNTVMIVLNGSLWGSEENREEILNSSTHEIVDETISAIGTEGFCASWGISLSAPDIWYLPEGIEYVGDIAFHLQDLAEVVMPSTLKEIGDSAFFQYSGWVNSGGNLSSVTLNDELEKIGSYAFCDCNLTEIEIPASVTEIGEYAFGYKFKEYDYDGNLVVEKIDEFVIYGYSGTAAEAYAEENGFTFVDISGSDSSKTDSLVVRRGNTFYFSYGLKSGVADKTISYGKDTDEVLFGDWDGDGVDTICVRRGNAYYFSNSLKSGTADTVVYYGKATDEVLVGDWDGDGKDTLAVRRGNAYYISNTIKSGTADKTVYYGKASDIVLAGDWDGSGKDSLAVRRGNTYYISYTIKSGEADKVVAYGKATDEVLVGDWNGNGVDTLTVRRGNAYYIINEIKSGNADQTIYYGRTTDEVYAGRWN